MTNRMMVTEAISGLNLDFFDNIYFICLQEHEDKYSFMKGFVAELDDAGLRAKSNVVPACPQGRYHGTFRRKRSGQNDHTQIHFQFTSI